MFIILILFGGKIKLQYPTPTPQMCLVSVSPDIITTSSWRAGQDLILKELGMHPSFQTKVKAKASTASQGQGEGHEDEAGTHSRGRSPDGAEAAARDDGTRAARNLTSEDLMVNEVVAKSKSLSEDTRHMLQELQVGRFTGGNCRGIWDLQRYVRSCVL